MALTPEQITMDWLRSITEKEFRAVLQQATTQKDPTLLALNVLLQDREAKKIVNEMVNDPDYVPYSKRTPDPAEAEQIVQDEALAAQQAQEAEAAAAAEQAQIDYAHNLAARNLAEDELAVKYGMVIERDEYGNVVKVVHEYQVVDEDGRPIGRPTHFESSSLVEAIAKVQTAHTNGMRYAERIKSNRFKQSAASLAANEKSAAADAARARSTQLATEAVNEKDPAKMQEAVRAVAEAERQADEASANARAHGKAVAEEWMAEHVHDFYPCEASSQVMGTYLKANNLSMTYDNLETAFQAVKSQLPPVPRPTAPEVVPVTPNNQPAVAAEAPAAAAAQSAARPAVIPVKPVLKTATPPAAPPASAATAPTPNPTANQPTVTRKPVVNGGLQPGQLSAQRPTQQQVEATAASTRSEVLREVRNMSPEAYRKKIATDAKFVERLKAAGIPVYGK